MANVLKIKAGSGVPTTSDIVDREIAFNRSNNKLYINDSGTIVDLSGTQGGGAADEADRIVFDAQAGEALSKGDVVYISGISGNTPIVSKADADDANKMPSFGLASSSASLNNSVQIVTFGTLENLDTSAFTVGDTVFVSTTAGGLTATPPTGESGLIQNMGHIVRSHQSTGAIKLVGAGRSAATPNLNEDKIFLGNASNQSVSTALSSIGLSKFNNDSGYLTAHPSISAASSSDNSGRTYIQDITLDSNGHVTGIATATETVTDTNTTYSAGTGLDLSGTTFSVDVSDFMSNGSNNRILTATGTDAMNAEANLTFDGSHLKLLVDGGKFTAGADEDAYFMHSGSHAWLNNSTGNLYIRNQTDDGQIIMQTDDGSGGTTTYMSLKGNEQLIRFLKSTRHNDGVIAQFGTGNDLKIQHDGSHSYIQNSVTGNLYIQQNVNDQDLVLQCDDGSGGTTAYLTLDGSAGYTTVQKLIKFEDSVDARFGTSSDLRIRHDGTDSKIDNYTGTLKIRNTLDDADITLETDDGSGGVTPYLTLDGSDTNVITHKQFCFEDTTAVINRVSNDLEIRTYGGYDINLMPSGNVGIGTTSPLEELDINGSLKVRGDSAAATEVVELGQFVSPNGNTPQYTFNTYDAAGGLPSMGDHLEIRSVRWGQSISFSRNGQGGAVPTALFYNGGNQGYMELYKSTNPTSDATYTTQVRLNVNGNSYLNGGNVGIGTSSPSKKLEVAGDVRIASGGDLILSDSAGGNDTFLYNDSQTFITYVNGAERMRIDSAGNVKVGTGNAGFSYASHGMEIAGSGNQSLRLEADGSTAFEISARTGDILLYNLGTARSIRFGVGGGEKFRINSDGNSYFYQSAIINTNNYSLSGRDTGGTVRTMLKIDTGNSILLGDNGLSGQVHMYPSTYTQINTNNGYLQIGPQNTSHCHYTTDRANHWFNQMIYVNGGVVSSYNSDLSLRRNGGSADRIDVTDTYSRVIVNDEERFRVTTGGATVTGNIAVSGTVDGRDVASDGSKLDGIESGATADQTITLTGDVTGSGTGSFATTIVDDSHNHSWLNSNTGDPGDSRLQYWQAANNTTLNPTTDWYNAIRMGHGDPVTYYANTLAIKMTGSGTGTIYTRTLSNGTQGSWNKHWHDNNDGSGSGLDADLLDGVQGTGYTRKGVQSGTPNTASNRTTFTCNDAIETSNGNQSGLEVWQDTAGADAFMTFHVAGDYAGYFGLDGSTNDLSWGGWSNGNGNKYKVWHAGNDGSGSTLDADLLDGLHGSSYWSKSGSWLGDLGSNGYTRVQGVSNGGGEFVLALKNGQLHTLLDGSYFAYEGSSAAGGGFWSSYNSAYGNATGFKATGTSTIAVTQQDGGSANLEVTGTAKISGSGGYTLGNVANQIRIQTDGVDDFSFLNTGNGYANTFANTVYAASDVRTADGTVASPAFRFTSDTDTGMYSLAANALGFSAGGTRMLSIKSDGNIELRSDGSSQGASIQRVGGIQFTWDRDSYGTSNDHSIRTISDDLVITSYDDVTINLDSNNNDSASTFDIRQHSTDRTSGTLLFQVDQSGNARATADVVAYYSSDKRLKDNLKPISNSLEKLQKLTGYEFDWNEKQDTYEGHDVGVVAQEVEEVLPEVVATRDSGYKAVKYEKMIPLLIEAIKEQQQQINKLEEKLNG